MVHDNTDAHPRTTVLHNQGRLFERQQVANEPSLRRHQLKISEARLLMDHLESSMRQSTYLQG